MLGNPARGRVGRVTDCWARGHGFKSPGSILTSRTETSSLSRVVRDGWDPCSVPVSGWKNSLLRRSLYLAAEQPQLFRKLSKNKNKTNKTTDVLKCFTISFAPLFLVLSLRSQSKSPLALAVMNRFRYLNTSISFLRRLFCTRLMRSRSWICWWQLRFLISGIIFVALLCIFSILSMLRFTCEGPELHCMFEMWAG